MELIAKSNSMSTAEISQLKAELKLKQKVKVRFDFAENLKYYISRYICLFQNVSSMKCVI